ncbi:MAG TPA: 16S rRNA (uracil(1498)-N(3))-methyltransferase [Desulfobulbaceae bacterium]|nr:16S rRNA (uracil(1498)-N(3))-methyltransferase [Desulfobulbaceae bacterium]
MRRFFVSPDQVQGSRITLTGREAHHFRSVLRLRCGQVVEFFDGCGTVYQVEITTIQSNLIEGAIVGQYVAKLDEPFPLTLAQVVLKGKKMDVVVQKATELGVNTLIPVISRYCEGRTKSTGRVARWQRIVIEACKQSGRAVPMHIAPVTSMDTLSVVDYRYRICCWEKEKQSLLLSSYLEVAGAILLLIGPEGGFHEQEMEWVRDNGFHIVTLGPHVLRAETAALAAVSIVKYVGSLAGAGC